MWLCGFALSVLWFDSVVGDRFETAKCLSKTGTTIVGVCCRDGVVFGADTRSTGGPLVIDKGKLKIHSLAPRMSCCAAGTSAHCDQVARVCSQSLSIERIERELVGETDYLDSVCFAALGMTGFLQTAVASRSRDADVIVGGVDILGPSLYHITKDGAQRTTYCALGSGAIDAISTLETMRQDWGLPLSLSFRDDCLCLEQTVENINVDDAINAVRMAVRAGIINDLGSGSDVDICVIQKTGIRRWREGGRDSDVGLSRPVHPEGTSARIG